MGSVQAPDAIGSIPWDLFIQAIAYRMSEAAGEWIRLDVDVRIEFVPPASSRFLALTPKGERAIRISDRQMSDLDKDPS